jgi:phosphate transport system protein
MHGFHHILDTKKRQIDANIDGLFDAVRDALDSALRCLYKQDRGVCEALIRNDAELHEKRRLVEQDCLVAIASQQPVANDLRDIVADMRIAGELERMGDYASDIAAAILKMEAGDLDHLGLLEVQGMAGMCQQILSHVKRAHREGDADLAERVARLDDKLDAAQNRIVSHLLAVMRSDSANVHNGARMLWIAHNLERCGDRATNIAAQVIFRIRGENVELG